MYLLFRDEPFGRTAMEAASRGCATIISKKGGLIETVGDTEYLENLSSKNLYKKIENLIKNKTLRNKIQNKSLKMLFTIYQKILKKLIIIDI